jgi:L-fuconolactonase
VAGRIDAHHHVWDLDAHAQPWISGGAMAPLQRSFGVEDLLEASGPSGIDATVVVQTIADPAETDDLLDLAERTPLIAGVVGWADLTDPRLGNRLDRLQGRPGGHRLVGIRSLVQDEIDPRWLLRPDVLRGLHEVADRGLAFDLLVRPHQLVAASECVAEVPHGRFVLDHLAKPRVGAGTWQGWADDLVGLAGHRHVTAKLSGLVTEADWHHWSLPDLQPYADHAIAAFGPERLMFGSDWPVCTLAATYEQVAATAEQLLAGLSPSDVDLVLGGTAASVYRLHVGSDEQ